MREIVEQTLGDFERSENAQLLQQNFQAAYRLMNSKQAREAFDLSQESTKTREKYGMNRFGQCCLLARRLIEAGRSLCHDQYFLDGVRRDYLGHSWLEAIYFN